jgi:hypothetical protein
MQILVRAIGVLAGVMFLLALPVLWALVKGPKPERPIPLDLHMPALAITFAPLKDIQDFLGARDSTIRQHIRKGLTGDYFFIAMYWLLFVGMSALLAARNYRGAVLAGIVAAVCATSAAIVDVLENRRTATLLDALKIQPDLVSGVASAGFGKWLLISLSTLVLSLVFFRSDWLVLMAVLYVLIGGTCIFGLLWNKPQLVEWSFLLNLVGLPVVAIVFGFFPKMILEHL